MLPVMEGERREYTLPADKCKPFLLCRNAECARTRERAQVLLDFGGVFPYSGRVITESLRNLSKAFSKYVLVGGVAFCLDYAVLSFTHRVLGWPSLAAAAAGFCCGVVCTYLCCNYWVFTHRKMREHQAREFAVFTGIGLVGLLLTLLFIGFFDGVVGLPTELSKLPTEALVLLWNFSARKIALY